ncbi:hypothetical protein OAH23_12075 [Verrucomicrobia bacterium]|nr:hypothetical protein [Verrucomicrobiota bacterium]MDB4691142.1 hypothetical protein [Verrucomicrobiota bacterium]
MVRLAFPCIGITLEWEGLKSNLQPTNPLNGSCSRIITMLILTWIIGQALWHLRHHAIAEDARITFDSMISRIWLFPGQCISAHLRYFFMDTQREPLMLGKQGPFSIQESVHMQAFHSNFAHIRKW